MIEHIAIMINKKGNWIDVYYNKETKEIYQAENCKIVDFLIGKAENKMEAEIYLENEFGSNIELD